MQNREVHVKMFTEYNTMVRRGLCWISMTEEFPDLSFLSKNPLKLNKSETNQIILIVLCRNRGNTSLRQLSSEDQYNSVVQAVLRYFTYCKWSNWCPGSSLNPSWFWWGAYLRGELISKFSKIRIDDYAKDGGPGTVWTSCSLHDDPLRGYLSYVIRYQAHIHRLSS